MATEVLWTALSDGGYRKHMAQLRHRLARNRREVAGRLAGLGIHPWVIPRGGFYLWCRLPYGVESTQIAQVALLEDVVLAPGDVFSPNRTKSEFMRFNVSQMSDPKIYDVLGRAISAV